MTWQEWVMAFVIIVNNIHIRIQEKRIQELEFRVFKK